MKLQFETKAKNLVNLHGLLDSAVVLPSVVLKDCEEWETRLEDICDLGELVIVRSSSRNEDTHHASKAGAFLSLANISTKDVSQLGNAIQRVRKSMTYEGGGGYWRSSNSTYARKYLPMWSCI